MRPTEEQQAILDSGGRVLLINARAGTGKTTTLQMITLAHPDLKILYLVFNRKAKEEANSKFPKNMEIQTVHSLAFTRDIDRWKDQVRAFTIVNGSRAGLPAISWSHHSQEGEFTIQHMPLSISCFRTQVLL